LNITNVKSFL